MILVYDIVILKYLHYFQSVFNCNLLYNLHSNDHVPPHCLNQIQEHFDMSQMDACINICVCWLNDNSNLSFKHSDGTS